MFEPFLSSAVDVSDQAAPKDATTAVEGVVMQRFSVPFEYPVVFTQDLLSPNNPVLAEALARREPGRRHRAVVLIDGGIHEARPTIQSEVEAYARHHADRLEVLTTRIVPGGEDAKNDPALVTELQALLQAHRVDRHAYVIAIGGGAMQDAVGYAAATTHRGVRLVRVPTTVLSQNDSGVGVKNGINAFGTKNFLGTFAPPFAVLNDIRFLDTLSARDRIAGMAEAIKVGLIRSEPFFRWLEASTDALASFEPKAMQIMIRKGAELHLNHIATSGDPFETGSARPLDFGHWSAHKLEALTDHRLRHGEAVAIGMALDTRYAVEIGMLDERCLERIFGVMERIGLRLYDEALSLRDTNGAWRVLQGLHEFREHLGGELTVTLLTDIGRGVEVKEMHEDAILRSIERLAARFASTHGGQ